MEDQQPKKPFLIAEFTHNDARWRAVIDEASFEEPTLLVERQTTDALGEPVWVPHDNYTPGYWMFGLVRVLVDQRYPGPIQNEASPAEIARDAIRYRRLRVLGCAPGGSPHLNAGTVLCFTNLDYYVDEDLRIHPSRGEAK